MFGWLADKSRFPYKAETLSGTLLIIIGEIIVY